MNTLCLPDHLTPLLMHIEPLLAAADQFQLGEPVSVGWSDSAVVNISRNGQALSVAFNALQQDVDFDIRDQWLAPYPSVSEVQQQVAANPSLVVCGLPTEQGCIDIWHHQGVARATYCHHAGSSEAQRAMLLVALALDFPLEDGVTLARAYARSYLESHTNGYGDIGWPTEPRLFPRALTANHPEAVELGWVERGRVLAPFSPVEADKLALYPVVDSARWVERLLDLGVKTVQLRIKDPNASALAEQIAQVVAVGRKDDAQVFVNDHWQLAIEHAAFGVHLGQEDLDTADLAAIQGAGLRLGLSTHGYYEILRAAEYHPSYIALGHIFPTTTKEMPSKPQGLNRLALYQKLIGSSYPTVAIGGIDLARAERVWRTGVSSVAVVRAVTEAEDPGEAVAAFARILIRPESGQGDADA
ncbi:thiamine-phosphate pyrophosphorylase [Photobacterium aquae]|uniref:Thiamine-phosphate synthase n=1 Tax=Photobacterium aquae TaxID=1195763 RepID=A0A0J1H6K1_9GAMM|nr:thiamine phosphate synthase [Photobacterium aquae]KLV07336.1 thiamine-phosphate pyrophosphorylase [Photobacterium aquae]